MGSRELKVESEKTKTIANIWIVGLISIIVSFFAFILNPGWNRLLLSFSFAPLMLIVYVVILIILSNTKSCTKEIPNTFYVISVLVPLTYLLMPDGGDGNPTVFLGLIKNQVVCNSLSLVSYLMFIVSIVLLIKLLIVTIKES